MLLPAIQANLKVIVILVVTLTRQVRIDAFPGDFSNMSDFSDLSEPKTDASSRDFSDLVTAVTLKLTVF